MSSRHEAHAEEHGPLKQLRTALNVEGALLVQASTQLVSPLAQAEMHVNTDMHVESPPQASSCEQQLASMHDWHEDVPHEMPQDPPVPPPPLLPEVQSEAQLDDPHEMSALYSPTIELE
jgi:hypothetical protein